MKIKDGLKLPADENGRVEIPNCKRRQLGDFFKSMGFKKGAEIGVYKGDFSRWLCKGGLELYSIDPWLAYEGYVYDKVHRQERQETLYASAKEKLAPYHNCHIIRKTSMEALNYFEDESLDFVYIDANHKFKYVVEDIHEWSKKVRKGGIISGHDYAVKKDLEVKYAVDAYTKANKIKKWYVLGRYETLPGEHRDQYRSWMWFK